MSKASDETTIRLPAELTIKHAHELQALLTSANEVDGSVSIDAGAVETVDTSGLQLLVAFSNSHVARDNVVAWQSVPDAIHQQVDRLGLSGFLDFDTEEATSADDNLCPVF